MTKLLLLTYLLLVAALGAAQPANYRLDRMIGTPVVSSRDVVVDRRGTIYLADGGVTKLDSTGRYIGGIAGGFTCLALDGADNLYVCNLSAPTGEAIRKYSPDGKLLLQCGTLGTGAGQIESPVAVCVGPTGIMYVATYRQLVRFDAAGAPLPVLPLPSLVASGSYWMKDAAIDAAGNLYLLYDNFFVLKVAPDGQVLAQLALRNTANYGRTETLTLDPAGDLLVGVSQGPLLRYSASNGALLGRLAQNFSNSTHTAAAYDRRGQLFATDYTHQQFGDHLYKFAADGTLLQRWGNLTPWRYVRQDEAGNIYSYDGRTVRKFNAAGQLTLSFSASVSQFVGGFAIDAQGYIYTLSTSDTVSELVKYDPQGQQVARYTNLGLAGSYQRFTGMAVSPTGYIYLSDYYGSVVRKLSPSGQFLGTIGTRGIAPGQLAVPRAIATDLAGNVYVVDNNGDRAQKFSAAGQFLRQYGQAPSPSGSTAVGEVDVEVDGRGNVYVASFWHRGRIFAADGRSETAMPSGGNAVSVSHDAARLLSLSNGSDVVRVYVTGAQAPTNTVSGQLYHDANQNCQRDADEAPLAGLVVVAEPGDSYALSDENGRYTLALDSGTYHLRTLPPPDEVGRTIATTCGPAAPLVLRGYNNAAILDFGHQMSVRPFVRVSVASNRRRRCFRNQTVVTYHNAGFAPAPAGAVTVQLPPEVVLVSASQPYSRKAPGQYEFALGTLGVGQQGTIVLQDSVVCGDPSLLGRTVCTKAWATPANNLPIPSVWNQASLVVSGRAEANNQVRFVVRNTGQRAMTDSLALRLYQDAELAMQHRYRLGAGDSLVLRAPATRAAVRAEAEQPAGHPTQRLSSATVEVRALAPAGQPSAAMVALPPNEPAPEVAEDCQPIRDSYDPNDKLVLPTGTTAQHYTPTGVPLHYRIRFQNTGNDDAYRVELVDTLAADLDLRTLRVEAASHPYRLSVAGHGRPVLTFTFDGIGLPPRAVNEAASNGFVQFSVQPKAGLAPKTLIENFADIFFDYNPAVRTPTVANRIYDVPPVVVPAVALAYGAVVASPALGSLAPAQGRVGALVTITGERLAAGSALPQVSFNGVAAPVLSASATSLTVRVPAGSHTGPVQVVTADGSARSAQIFTVYQAPVITSIAPAEGVVGTLLTITGTDFAPLAAQDTVWLGAVAAPILSASATSLTVRVPAGASSGPVRLGTLGGQARSAQAFTLWGAPIVLSFSPASGKAGTLLTLTGTNWAPAARTSVRVGGAAASVVQVAGSTLQVRVPADAQSGRLAVQTPGGTATSATDFEFLPAPQLLGFAPAAGSVGEVLTLTGRNFLVDGRPDTVYLGQQPMVVLSATATTATVRVPFGAASGPLTVAGAGGRASSATAFTILSLRPDEALVVYPNPAHGTLSLDWLRADFAVEKAQLYNALGAAVFAADIGPLAGTNLQIPLASVQPGLYLLVVHTARGPVTKRITVY